MEHQKEMTVFAQKKQDDFQRYSQAIQQKAAARKNELMTPVVAEINAKIADYANAHGYTIIFGTTDGNIVYAEDAVNVTAEVIGELNLNP